MKENKKRNKTAKELAKITGKSERTIRSYFAQDRSSYEEEAKKRRLKAYELKNNGLKLAEIATALGCSYHAAAGLIKRYKQQDLTA
ncbi:MULTISPECIES: helix-turn-helix domain-containing protein [Enterobacteriaceae]|mgnify:FL=1|uniref:helix-turn-helix domain-containing protein n=1 Tax=Enterobacteriaceae TaxID=543 RepID=UPI000CDDDAC0|nr:MULTISPECIES: helix-turn-helix domain-containing protein [Enterobacteriaceae]MCQ3960192.1 plasmid replication protein [Klebsiella pneumoniae]POU05632.1 plasmid replication protein [Citrobacter freundii complex sp. CFNIH7]